MTDAAEKVLDEAMKLPDSERRTLALWLLDSLGDEAPADVERAWRDEGRPAPPSGRARRRRSPSRSVLARARPGARAAAPRRGTSRALPCVGGRRSGARRRRSP